MSNEFYNHDTGVPANLSRGSAVLIRQELDKIGMGFGRVPALAKLATNSTGFVLDTGGVNAFVLAGVPDVTELATGMEVRFKALSANTGAATINVNGIGVKPVVRTDGNPLEVGDIFAGQMVTLTYDAADGGRWQYASSAASSTAAARAYAQQASESAGAASASASGASGSAGAAAGSASAAASSAAAALESAESAALSAGSVQPGFLYPERITANAAAQVDRSYELAASDITLELPTPDSSIAGRCVEFVNTSGDIDPATAPAVDFGSAPLNRGTSPGLMRLVTGNTRRIRVTATAPWGWTKA